MATSATGYGAYNPNAVDPFPIEQTLAQIVGTNNPAQAGNLLDSYRVKNMVASDNYDYAMNQQHDFAKQQLQATIEENALKAAMEGVKTPGGLTTAAAMNPSIAQRLQGIMGPIETNLARAQAATTAEHGSSAGYHAVQAGYPLPLGEFQRITGTNATLGTPLQMQIELMKEGAADRRAAAHAAASADDGYGLSIPLGSQAILGGAAPTLTVGKKGDVARALAKARAQGIVIPEPVKPPAGAMAPSGGATAAQPSAQPAKPATGGGGATTQPVQHSAQGGGDVHAQAEAYVENVVRPANQKMYNDIQAGKVGGKVNLVTTPDGKMHIQGKERQY